MKKIIKFLFLMVMVFIGLNCVRAEISEENAAKYLEKEYGVEADKYCYYVSSTNTGMIIAVSKGNEYAYADVPRTWGGQKFHEGEPIVNWDPHKGCQDIAIIEQKGKLLLAEFTLKLYDADNYSIPTGQHLILRKIDIENFESGKTCYYNSKIYIAFTDYDQPFYWPTKVKLSDEFYLNAEMASGCPTIYACKRTQWSRLKATATDTSDGKYDYEVFFSNTSSGYYKYDESQCQKLTGSTDGICPGFMNIESKYISNEKRRNEELTAYCEQVFKGQSYEKPCSRMCIAFKEETKEELVINTENCGFSEKLIIWVMNIIRWVKYIVPVLLIVLSILDFIKAIASDKEDEMKKAQKHFATRLIVAVLIFIAPLIIEFVFDKMGFSVDNCGISNIGFGK